MSHLLEIIDENHQRIAASVDQANEMLQKTNSTLKVVSEVVQQILNGKARISIDLEIPHTSGGEFYLGRKKIIDAVIARSSQCDGGIEESLDFFLQAQSTNSLDWLSKNIGLVHQTSSAEAKD